MLRNRSLLTGNTQNGHDKTFKDKPITDDLCQKPIAVFAIFLFCVFFVISLINSNSSIFDWSLNTSSKSKHSSAITNKNKQSDILNNLNDISTTKNFVYSQEYLHNMELSEISNPLLKSKKLQQLFRFEFNKLIITNLKNGEIKQPNDGKIVKLLSNLYLKNHEIVNFIQIGACDGDWTSSNDPIQKLLLTSKHWRGVMMEPVPYLFNKLEKSIQTSFENNFNNLNGNYKNKYYLLNAALSDRNGKQQFYIVNDNFAKEMPQETHALKFQIGSFNKQHIIKHLKVKKDRKQLSKDLDHYISIIDVTAMTPDKVVSQFYNSNIAGRDGTIDVLLIDAEGYDLVVLQSFMNIPEIRPSVIIYENLHLKPEQVKTAEETLENYGYIVFKVGWNTMGVRVAEI